MGSEGCRKVTARLPPPAEAALGKLLAQNGLTLRDLLLRLVALDAATAPVRGSDGLLAWLEAVARAGPPVAREQGRLGLLARRRQEEERRLAEAQARRRSEEQAVAALQAQARRFAAALREAQQAAAVLGVAKPEALHLAALLTGLLDGRLPGVISQEALRLLVGASLLAARRARIGAQVPPPAKLLRQHPDLPALGLEQLLTWSLTALAPPGGSRPAGSPNPRDGNQSRY